MLILAAAPAQVLDIAGPAEVLAQAGRLHHAAGGEQPGDAQDAPLYTVAIHIIPQHGAADTSAGIGLRSSITEAQLRQEGRFDTLIVAGGEGARLPGADPGRASLVRRLAEGAGRVVGVCTGAFLLAEAGLLAGKRVTTHWRWCAALAAQHPGLRVDPDPIYIQDGRVWTSAGITAGMDLTLALVERGAVPASRTRPTACTARGGTPVTDVKGLRFLPDADLADAPPLNLLHIAGGYGQEALMEDEAVLGWVRRQAEGALCVFSACTGALICGAAGLLQGRRATTHWTAFHLLSLFGAIPVDARVVVDGKFVFAAGVTAGIDGALRVAADLRGDEAAQVIQLYMAYAPEPPFDAGTPGRAPPQVVVRARAAAAEITAQREVTARQVGARLGCSRATENIR